MENEEIAEVDKEVTNNILGSDYVAEHNGNLPSREEIEKEKKEEDEWK